MGAGTPADVFLFQASLLKNSSHARHADFQPFTLSQKLREVAAVTAAVFGIVECQYLLFDFLRQSVTRFSSSIPVDQSAGSVVAITVFQTDNLPDAQSQE